MKNLRFKSLLVPFITILTIFVLTVFLLAPRLRGIGNLRNLNRNYQKILSVLTIKLSQLENLNQNELKSQAEKIISVLPIEPDIPNSLIVSRALTVETGLTINKMTVESANISSDTAKLTKGNTLPSYTITINAAIGLEKIVPFLERVVTASPLLGFEKIYISSRGQNIYEINYVLKNYYLAYPKEIGSPETPLPQITAQENNIYISEVQNLKPLASLETITPTDEFGQTGKANPFMP